MTAAPADQKLPLWRLLTGAAVLGVLVGVAILAGGVYLNDFGLDRYMRSLAEQPSLSDAELTGRILAFAKGAGLPLTRDTVVITRAEGKPHIRIDKFTVQTRVVKLDLRLPAAESH